MTVWLSLKGFGLPTPDDAKFAEHEAVLGRWPAYTTKLHQHAIGLLELRHCGHRPNCHCKPCLGTTARLLCLHLSSDDVAMQGRQGPPPSAGVGLLQLAINSSSHSMASNAAAAAVRLPAAQAPDVARKLLVTAATRGHSDAVGRLGFAASVQQHLDAHTMERVLEQLMIAHEPRCFKVMCSLSAGRQLGSAAVANLLQTALQQGQQGCVDRLLEFLAAAQLSADMVAQLLHALLKCSLAEPTRVATQLCGLVAAQHLSSTTAEQLLHAAIKQNGGSHHSACVEPLVGLPAAGELSSDSALLLALAAVQHKSVGCYRWLSMLPGVGQLDSAALELAIEEALDEESGEGTAFLCDLPGAAQLSTDAVARLLSLALERNHSLYQRLVTLPAAQQLSTNMVVQLVQAAMKQRNSWVVERLCRLPAADGFSTSVSAQLLQEAVQLHCDCVTCLCRLPGVEQLSCNVLAQLLLGALQAATAADACGVRMDCVRCLRQLPAARQLSKPTVAQLLQVAAEHGMWPAYKMLSELPGARH